MVMKQHNRNKNRVRSHQSLFDITQSKNGEYPSLYDFFKLGDRVKRKYKDNDGKTKEYGGIILAIKQDNIEIYWDTKDGEYKPDDMDLTFTNCTINEIFKGDDHYSPIKKR